MRLNRLFIMMKYILIFAPLYAMLGACTPTTSNKRCEEIKGIYYAATEIDLLILHPSKRRMTDPIVSTVIKPNQTINLWGCEVIAENKSLCVKYKGKELRFKEGSHSVRLYSEEERFEYWRNYEPWEERCD